MPKRSADQARVEPEQKSIQPLTRGDWRQWLDDNHLQSTGIWLTLFKKSSGQQTFTFDEAIEEALCFGWIDSKPSKLDANRSMLYFAPRKPGSGWSRLNKQRIERLLAHGQMQPAGLEKLEAAQRDGSWNKLDAVEELVIPSDLEQAFTRWPSSQENFTAFPRSAQRGILEWIVQAKREATRAKRIEETARLASENIRANQWPRTT